MGTWGPGLFDNDTARDVQNTFENALEGGVSVEDATERVLAEYRQWLQDEDDRPSVWLALAALQLKQQALQPKVQRQALAIIEGEDALRNWEESDPADLVARRQILGAFKEQLTTGTSTF